MGIIGGVTVPRYVGSFDSVRFRKAMSEVVYFLREARIKAMSTARPSQVTIDLYKGFCWNDDKKILKLPDTIEVFTDRIEARDDQTRTFTFFPNGTALAQKLGFVCDKMVAVLHVEPLGGLVSYKIGEEMEQVVRYGRGSEGHGEDIEKYIDKLKDSDTLAKAAQTGRMYLNNDEDDDDESDDEAEFFDDEEESDEDMEEE